MLRAERSYPVGIPPDRGCRLWRGLCVECTIPQCREDMPTKGETLTARNHAIGEGHLKGLTLPELSQQFGLKVSTVYRILLRLARQ